LARVFFGYLTFALAHLVFALAHLVFVLAHLVFALASRARECPGAGADSTPFAYSRRIGTDSFLLKLACF